MSDRVRWIHPNQDNIRLMVGAIPLIRLKVLTLVGDVDGLSMEQATALRELGFTLTDTNVWLRRNLRFSLPEIRRVFPQAQAVEMSRDKMMLRAEAGGTRNEDELRVRAALMQVRPLGRNDAGDSVYEFLDGLRAIEGQDGVRQEGEVDSPADVLRAPTAADLARCADAYANLVAERLQRFDDLVRFATLISDEPGDISTSPRLREVQEAVEAAIVRRFAAHGRSAIQSLDDSYADAQRLLEQQPVLAARTTTSIALQQYSTPLTLGAVVQHIIGPVAGKHVCEPTVGNGALLSHFEGAAIVGVDLDPMRVAHAQRLLPTARIVQGDATEFNFKALGPVEGFDIIVANPPFGSLGKYGSRTHLIYREQLRVDRIDHLILLRALEARRDKGLAVFIIAADSPIDREAGRIQGGSRYLFNWLADHYTDVEVVEVDGGLYAKQGSSYPVRLVVVGPAGKSAQPVPDMVRVIRDHRELVTWAKIQRARHEARHAAIDVSVLAALPPVNTANVATEPAIIPSMKARLTEYRPFADLPEHWLVMNAARPLLGHRLLEGGEFLAGRFYAAIDPADSMAARYAEENHKLDARVVLHASVDTQQQMALEGRRYRDSYLAMPMDERTKAMAPLVAQLQDKTVAELRALQQQAPLVASPTAEKVPPAAVVIDPEADTTGKQSHFAGGITDTPAPTTSTASEAEPQSLWQMPQEEWLAQAAARNQSREVARAEHEAAVHEQVQAGTLVPAEVLADYADLALGQVATMPSRPAIAVAAAMENLYQAPYQPVSQVGAASAMIPRNMALPVRNALAQVELVVGDIDRYVGDSLQYSEEELARYFTPEQIDALALAFFAHEHKRQSVLNGDMTGQGKGRVAAAMARYALLRDQPVIFLTETALLFSDWWRDLRDIGSEHLVRPLILNDSANVMDPVSGKVIVSATAKPVIARALAKDDLQGANVVLATYSQFNRSADKSVKSRWLSQVARGAYVLLDESHNAAGESNTRDNIQKAIAVADGVYYSSATSIKAAGNVQVYHKIFPSMVNVAALPETLSLGGEVLQETLSSMLAEDGVFIRREHDLSNMTFSVVTDQARFDRNVALADHVATILELMSFVAGDVNKVVAARNREIKQLLEKIPEKERDGKRMQAVSLNFGSRLFNLYRQFQLAISVDNAVDQAYAALERGQKPVFVLESTMESLLNETIADNSLGFDDDEAAAVLTGQVELSDRLTYRDLLMRTARRLRTYTEITGYGQVLHVPISDESTLASLEVIEDRILELPDLPISPLDDIRELIEARGYRCEELSGRKVVIEQNPESARYVVRPRAEKPRAVIVRDFNAGLTDALIVTRAGATGISLHASETFADQRQRNLIEVQPAADVNKRMQFFGRVNRRGQVVAPVLTTLSTGLVGQARTIAMQNAKLRRLSANTTANQDNSGLNRDVPDLLNEVGDEVAFRFLEAHPAIAYRLDIAIDPDGKAPSSREEHYYINKLMMRMIMLPNAEQEQIYEALNAEYRRVIDELNAKGINPFRTMELDVRARVVAEEVYTPGDPRSASPFAKPVMMKEIEWDEMVVPVRSRAAKARMECCESALQAHPLWADNSRTLISNMLARLRQQREALLRAVLPKNMKCIDAALADKKANGVKVRAANLDRMQEVLRPVGLGSRVQLTHPYDPTAGELKGVIVGLQVPDELDKLHLPGRYFLDVAVPGESQVRRISLNTLMGDSQFRAWPPTAWDQADLFRAMDEAPEGKQTRSRVILDGNLFLATQEAATRRMGTGCIVTDEEGRRMRTVLLYGGAKMADLKQHAVRLVSAKLAAAFLRTYPQAPISSSTSFADDLAAELRLSARSGRGDPDIAVLTVPGTKVNGGKYLLDEELGALVGEFAGNRETMVARFPMARLEEVLAHLYRKGGSFHAPGELREAAFELTKQASGYANERLEAVDCERKLTA